jgi:predicted oxidoreductase
VSNTDDANDLSDRELDAIERRAASASPGPWTSFIEGRDHLSGDTFIRIGGEHDDTPDMYVSISEAGQVSKNVPDSDLDFIAHARQDVPRLVAEVRRLQGIISDLP